MTKQKHKTQEHKQVATGGSSRRWIVIISGVLILMVIGSIADKNKRTAVPPQAQVAIRSSETPVREPTITRAPMTSTPTLFPTATTAPVVFYVTGNANGRSCPKSACDVVQQFKRGDPVTVTGYEIGDAISGSDVWRITSFEFKTVYIHSSLLALHLDSAAAVDTAPTTARQAATAVPEVEIVSMPEKTYYTISLANARSCPRLDCIIVRKFAGQVPIQVVGTAQGDSTAGSTSWYAVDVDGQQGFMHISLLSEQPPAVVSAGSGGSAESVSTAPAVVSWDCSIDYDCGFFSTCDQAMAYFAACPGDPSNLDGGAGDGVPCNSDGRVCEGR